MERTRLTLLALFLCLCSLTWAQDFGKWFEDKTLRIDYIFSGDVNQQHIAVDELSVEPRWYGKKQKLTELPMEGNGQITVRDRRSGKSFIEILSQRCFRSGCPIPKQRRQQKVSRMYFSFPCQKIPLTSLSTYATVTEK